MVSTRDKRRIKEEEIFRDQVRKELSEKNEPKTPIKKWEKFFNTGLGLWFLSLLCLASIPWGYTLYQGWRENHNRKTETIKKIRRELLTRIENLQLEIFQDSRTPEPKLDIKRYVSRLISAPGNDRSVIPEFANRSMQSLVYELTEITDGEEQNEANFVKDDLDNLPIHSSRQTNPELDLDQFENKLEEMYKHLIKVSSDEIKQIRVYRREKK